MIQKLYIFFTKDVYVYEYFTRAGQNVLNPGQQVNQWLHDHLSLPLATLSHLPLNSLFTAGLPILGPEPSSFLLFWREHCPHLAQQMPLCDLALLHIVQQYRLADQQAHLLSLAEEQSGEDRVEVRMGEDVCIR